MVSSQFVQLPTKVHMTHLRHRLKKNVNFTSVTFLLSLDSNIHEVDWLVLFVKRQKAICAMLFKNNFLFRYPNLIELYNCMFHVNIKF